MTRCATLDVGTNTVLLLVAEAAGERFRPVLERAEITRLGRGVDRTGRLSDEAIAETVAVLARFADEARSLGATELACVATSASRDASNGPEFLEQVRARAGVTPEIIDGELEADLTYASARRELGTSDPIAVLDIGGGSSELVFGAAGQVSFKHSFNLGSVRLTERLIHHDPPLPEEREAMTRLLDEAFASLPVPDTAVQLVGIAGTVTTLCAVSRGIAPYDAERVHLSKLTDEEVRAETDRYFRLPVAELRALPGMEPRRAEVIAAGALILQRVMARLGAREVTVSDRGIRWGLLYQRFGHLLQPG